MSEKKSHKKNHHIQVPTISHKLFLTNPDVEFPQSTLEAVVTMLVSESHADCAMAVI